MVSIARMIAIAISWMLMSLAITFDTWITALLVLNTWGVFFLIEAAKLPSHAFYEQKIH